MLPAIRMGAGAIPTEKTEIQDRICMEAINIKTAVQPAAQKAMEKDTGARALRAIIEEFMLDIMYEIPKDDNIGKVTITREYIENTGGPVIDIRSNSIELPDNLNVIKG